MYPPNHTLLTPKGTVTIRPGVTGDAVQLSELRQEALRDNPTVYGSSYDFLENCTPEWALKVLSEDPQENCIFLAECDHELLGMTVIRRTHGHKVRHQANLFGVFVRPDWRGLGIVDGIFAACFEWARMREIVILKLGVVTTNPAAVKAYQRLGFNIFGTEPKGILSAGVYYDEYLMAKDM